MQLLTIMLEEGYLDERVILKVNGTTVFDKESVKTKLLLGFADSVSINLQQTSANIEISIPNKGMSLSLKVMLDSDKYIAFSVKNTTILHRISNEPFVYL
ncbi:MAG: hypothetical protein N3I35_02195 [Clostridia bacterium]|nr:hypothetical protein [Clostridia bacterium]